ncbi:MAG: 3,4-dihydroxy-2-butanone-4-phosphate synthase [Paracoccus sp. (in: a-proteobacteria)]
MHYSPRGLTTALDDALAALRAGQGVLVADDATRENEVDFVFAAETLTEAQMALMIRHGSGIVCPVITADCAARMGLAPMVPVNGTPFATPFTVSVEAAQGVTTGVSAADRCRTIAALTAPDAVKGDLIQPGHVFPLVARPEGLAVRRGHTEATLALMSLAGLRPAGVLCEAMTDDGHMISLSDVPGFAPAKGMPLVTIAQIEAAWLTRA